MILLYDSTLPGEVFYAVYQYDWERGFSHSTNIPLSEFEIQDEVQNAALCADLVHTQNKRDATGQRKYFMDNPGPALNERDGWVEFVEPPE